MTQNNELLEAAKSSLQWFAKLAADQPEGDPTGIGQAVMRQHAKVKAAIANAEEKENPPNFSLLRKEYRLGGSIEHSITS